PAVPFEPSGSRRGARTTRPVRLHRHPAHPRPATSGRVVMRRLLANLLRSVAFDALWAAERIDPPAAVCQSEAPAPRRAVAVPAEDPDGDLADYLTLQLILARALRANPI